MTTQSPPCPYCGGTSYQRVDARRLVCRTCAHEFDINQDLCRACGHLNRAESTTCRNCKASLNKADAVAPVFDARLKGRQEWQKDRLSASLEQKKQGEEASRQRMESFWAEEQARQQAVARAMAERQKKERQAMLVGGIVLGAIVMIAVAVWIVSLFI